MGTEVTITPPTFGITVVLVVLILALPRKHLLAPFVAAACFVPAEQHALIFGLHFYVLRILVIAGILRILLRGENRAIRWNRLDKLLLAWALVESFAYILLRMDGQAVVFRCGQMLEILGIYWIVRQAIRSWDDIKAVCKLFALCGVILIPLVAIEWSTGSNPFAVLGRVYTGFREGEFRCQASFPHAIIAGAFWACLFPIFIGLALRGRHKTIYWAGAAATVFIIIACHSSTPIGGLGAAVFFVALYKYRHYGRYMAMGFFGTLLALHMVMKSPVWSLLCRVTIIAGSTGYHRYILINGAIQHLREWALLGTLSTAHWGYHLYDVTNQYVLEGVRGGLLTLILFIAILVVAIRATAQYSLKNVPDDRKWLSWGICTSVLTHCVMFIGVGYFGQILMLLYMTFAFAGTIYEWNAQLTAPAGVKPRGKLSQRTVVHNGVAVVR